MSAEQWKDRIETDGFGDALVSQAACTQPTGHVSNSTDCDDTNAAINPSASEVCDSVDNDCDGLTDDADSSVTGQPTWYQDSDGDGFGNAAVSQAACTAPSGHVSNSTDCDDTNAAINPSATEVCDGADNDCDGLTDDADSGVTGQPTWYQDSDGDGFGNA